MMKLKIQIGSFLLCVALLSACGGKNTLFTEVSSSTTHIEFENKLEKKELFSILYYLYYYNGGGVATGDINNDGLPDIYFTANSNGHNKLYLNKGNFQFEDITEKAGVKGSSDWCSGVSMADVNGDGFLDIYVSSISGKYNLVGHNELFINNGNGTFTEKSKEYGLDFIGFTTQTAFFDYDRDGDMDCYLLNQSHHPHANITDTSNRRKYDAQSGDVLFRNDLKTTGKFTDVSKQAGIYQSNLGYGLGIAIGDLNNDGWDDIYVGNDFHENDYYYINNGANATDSNITFKESGAAHFKHYSRFSMGNDIADYNNDGQLDVITVDMLPQNEHVLKTYGSDENPDTYSFKLMRNGYQYQYSKNCLQRNNGNGASFSESSLLSNVAATDWSWCPLFADFDNDGNKDLFISSGIVKRPVDLDYVKFVSDLYIKKSYNKTDKYDDEALDKMPDGSSHPFFYHGSGNMNFEDVSKQWGTGDMKGYYNGAAYADLDNDGNLDMVINSLNSKAVVLKNNAPKQNQLTISLKGDGNNKFGVGAKVYLFSQGKQQYQQLMLTRGFQSSCETRLHFGLGAVATADSLLIVWPNQTYQVIKQVKANQPLSIEQKNAAGQFNYNQFFPSQAPVLEDITSQVALGWQHRENNFDDYNIQYLIPHAQSNRGPKVAVADVNKDGLEDFYACGAANQPGSLFIQTPDGRFVIADTATFGPQAKFEDTDALFFDANNDGAPDLYVTSGGNEQSNNSKLLADHLYINDGKGHFSLSANGIPALLTNKSCVKNADVDKDGDQDLFVGSLADAIQYGFPQNSYLLINDGKGQFNLAPETTINTANLGLVTSAAFADIDVNGYPDLIVSGEWMPIKIFMNTNGRFQAMDIPKSTGLWQSLLVQDINNDGKPDIVAGNWGLNNKFSSGKQSPLKLFVKDFDNNGTVEQIMAYTIDGKEYTFLPKDELERPLPVLKKAYLTYSEVAGKPVDYMLYDLFKDYLELKAENLSSTAFINNGKGTFTAESLAPEAQLAPIMCLANMGTSNSSFFAAGNFYFVPPYEGRYDALLPAVYQKNKQQYSYQPVSYKLDGEFRDAKWINYKGKPTLILTRNNGNISFLQTNTPTH